MNQTLDKFKEHLKKMRQYEQAVCLLNWDLQTMAPKKGVESKLETLGFFSTESFKLSTSEEYGAMLSETAVSGLLSFEALLDTQGRGARQRISGESGNPPEELCEEQELHETLKQGISSLREKEQLVLSLYYEKELSMKEIAQVLNVSAPRISQIHSRAIEHLRQYMKQYMEAQ